jgi:hypothetical protein
MKVDANYEVSGTFPGPAVRVSLCTVRCSRTLNLSYSYHLAIRIRVRLNHFAPGYITFFPHNRRISHYIRSSIRLYVTEILHIYYTCGYDIFMQNFTARITGFMDFVHRLEF